MYHCCGVTDHVKHAKGMDYIKNYDRDLNTRKETPVLRSLLRIPRISDVFWIENFWIWFSPLLHKNGVTVFQWFVQYSTGHEKSSSHMIWQHLNPCEVSPCCKLDMISVLFFSRAWFFKFPSSVINHCIIWVSSSRIESNNYFLMFLGWSLHRFLLIYRRETWINLNSL